MQGLSWPCERRWSLSWQRLKHKLTLEVSQMSPMKRLGWTWRRVPLQTFRAKVKGYSVWTVLGLTATRRPKHRG